MTKFTLLADAYHCLDEIYDYTVETWDEGQAIAYTKGLFDFFEKITRNDVLWRPIPAELEVSGYFARYQKHFVYWKKLKDNRIAIVTILHERQHQITYLAEAFGLLEPEE